MRVDASGPVKSIHFAIFLRTTRVFCKDFSTKKLKTSRPSGRLAHLFLDQTQNKHYSSIHLQGACYGRAKSKSSYPNNFKLIYLRVIYLNNHSRALANTQTMNHLHVLGPLINFRCYDIPSFPSVKTPYSLVTWVCSWMCLFKIMATNGY